MGGEEWRRWLRHTVIPAYEAVLTDAIDPLGDIGDNNVIGMNEEMLLDDLRGTYQAVIHLLPPEEARVVRDGVRENMNESPTVNAMTAVKTSSTTVNVEGGKEGGGEGGGGGAGAKKVEGDGRAGDEGEVDVAAYAVLNPDLDWDAIAARYWGARGSTNGKSSTERREGGDRGNGGNNEGVGGRKERVEGGLDDMDGMVVVDDILSSKAWQRIITICKASTVFNDVHSRGYLGAYACDGLHERVLWEVARELRARLPSIFRCVGLETFWIYKVCVDC